MEFGYRLKKLKLAGFKSFCDRKELVFPAGITIIVGPNGCGKSNLADAIIWALGEQSLRLLRAKNSEDLIFVGSGSRKPVGMAEVSIHFSPKEEDEDELIISRRLYRSGECGYFINRRPVRLRDVQDITLGTGMWTKGYLLLDQERVSFLLECRLEERRIFIEEAAGITKYKLRRNQAETKLTSTKENLVRLNDIILEVEKQRNGLKRQAAKARRYKKIRKRMREIKELMLFIRFNNLSSEQRKNKEEVTQLTEEEIALATRISQREAELEGIKTELMSREEDRDKEREVLYKFDIEIEKKRHITSQLKGDIRRIEGDIVREEEELSALISRLEKKKEEEKNLPRLEEEEKREFDDTSKEVEDKEALIGRLAEKIKGLSSLISQKKEGFYRLQSELSRREGLLDDAQKRFDGIEIPSLKAKQEKLLGDVASISSEKKRKEAELSNLEEKIASLAGKEKEIMVNLSNLNRKKVESERQLASLQEELFPLKGRYHTLCQLLGQKEGVIPSFKDDSGFNALGVLGDSIRVAPGYEKAVEAFLGELLHGMMVKTPEEALTGINSLVSADSRSLSFIIEQYPIEEEPSLVNHPLLKEEGVIAPLSQMVEATGVASYIVPRLFSRVVLVDELEKGVSLAKQYPRFIFVSVNGDRIGPPGILSAGGDGAFRILSLRREREELGKKIDTLAQDIESLTAGIKEKSKKIDILSKNKAEVERSIKELSELRINLKEELIEKEAEEKELTSAEERLQKEIAKGKEEKRRIGKKVEELSDEVKKKSADISSYEEELHRLSREIELLSEERKGIEEDLSQLRLSRAVLSEKLSHRGNDRSRLSEEVGFFLRQVEEIERRLKTMKEELAIKMKELKEEGDALSRLFEEKSKAEEMLSEVNLLIEEKKREVKEHEGSVVGLRRKKEELGEGLEESKIKLKVVEKELSHLAEECFEAFGIPPAELVPESQEEEKGEGELKMELSELSNKVERMGGLNLTAEEEFEKIDERYQFLLAQREDILSSISSLREIIEKIDRTSREKFRQAFLKISENFSEVFLELFGGGRAELILTGDGDILEAGVDILAQPPGKRLKTISLLSGGEKTLSAIAFLFAIFRYHPSPFCLLDEVDATLDDPNAKRFSTALKKFSKKTQFIIMTHNKITMEIGEVIYGVTMNEEGLSQIISVKME